MTRSRRTVLLRWARLFVDTGRIRGSVVGLRRYVHDLRWYRQRSPESVRFSDTYPQVWLPWADCSAYATTVDDAVRILDTATPRELSDMGSAAADLYQAEFKGTRWCERILQVLGERRFR